MNFLLFEHFNQIVVEEKPRISSSSKESIPHAPDRKSKGKKPEEDKLEVEDSEEIKKIKFELKKMRRNLDRAIEDPEKWLARELSGTNEADEGEIPQKKFKMDIKPSEVNSSGIEEDYLNLFHEETRHINDIKKNLINKEPKYETIKTITKRKFEELENKSSIIPEDGMDQVQDKGMTKRIKKIMEAVLEEGKLV
ncbi:hypothetical protein O181_024369 [Austropuccinia psidii MF-1]|uniref:Uncharacterized protein n=1 Tax=Austropuccinia psidii MF-1 TaxID=1389203 RepID=A0A9Q3CIJ0_9BASI|nr:hypothetical protein [Austropuccinia psidii MF-1]